MSRAKRTKKIPLFDLKLSAAARREANRTLESGWLTAGKKVRAFEKAVAELTGVEHTVGLASGTQALHLALAGFGGLLGREVITTPYTFVATVEAILQAGGQPVFADIDPATFNIDPDEVLRKHTKHTAAVVPVDVAGHPAEYQRLNEICEAKGLLLVSDAAHAIGAMYKRKSVAQWCDAAVYSFYSTKNLTCGEGGMLVTPHEVLAERVRLISRHGLDSSTYERRRGNQWEYDVVEFGYKANMSELHAAIGLGEMKRFGANQQARAQRVGRYMRNLKGLSEFVDLPGVRKGCGHGWHLFMIKLRLEALTIDRDRFIREMGRRGVECGVHYKPMFELSWYREAFGIAGRFFPNAAYAWQRAVTLPLFPTLRLSDVDYVCGVVEDVCREFGG